MKMKKEHQEYIRTKYEEYIKNNPTEKEKLEKFLIENEHKYSHVQVCYTFFKMVKIEGDSAIWAFDNLNYLLDSHRLTIYVKEFKRIFPMLRYTTKGEVK